MKPVMQTILGEDGNCFSACIASLFDLHIEEVPNFVTMVPKDGDWAAPLREWLRPRGFGFLTIGLNGDESILQGLDGYVIVSGQSSRGLYHATIWHRGELVHDPHPSQCGIRSPEFVDLVYPLDPARLGVDKP